MTWLNGVAEQWFGWMWPMFWQVNLLIVIIWLVDALIRRWAWPQVRYALWLLVLLKLVIPPMWTLPVSVTEPLVRPVVERFEAGAELLATTSGGGALATEAPSPMPAAPGDATATRDAGALRPVWQVWPFLIWFVGMAIFCGILWQRLHSLRRWHDAQHPRQTIPEWYHDGGPQQIGHRYPFFQASQPALMARPIPIPISASNTSTKAPPASNFPRCTETTASDNPFICR